MTALPRRLLAALVLLGALALAPGNARAETYQTCAGFIESLPATITTQGVWCLRENLATAITEGNAITIATNNVTIDCNGFKIGGLAAGDGSKASGIYADGRQNAIVRQCNVRGFYIGVRLHGGAGHLVQENRLDNNLYIGISVLGDNNRVVGNAIYDTGGSGGILTIAINAEAHVLDNTVAGVFGTATSTYPIGIYIRSPGNVAANNRVAGVQVSGDGSGTGIVAASPAITIDGNRLTAPAGTPGEGIRGNGATNTACSNNVVAGFNLAMTYCMDAGHNIGLSL